MNKIHIIVKLNSSDGYAPVILEGEHLKLLDLDQGSNKKIVRTWVMQDLKDLGMEPSNPAYDFLQFAIAVYTTDQTLSRSSNGFQGWSRHIEMHFPVHDVKAWTANKESLEGYVSFLSGDKWTFTFRKTHKGRTPQTTLTPNPDKITKVCLLSGGMDSLIGAVDLLAANEKPFFVGHYKTGTESSVQQKILNALTAKYTGQGFKHKRFYVQPVQRHELAQKENTSRARSLLFIALGITCANCLGDSIELILPENGLISLNVPLTYSRLSSHSTRTTHPYFVHGLNTVLERIGIINKIVNPYRFQTKGEMIINSLNRKLVLDIVPNTISCSHPENSRYTKGSTPGLNCGYCVPCIIRQAAEFKADKVKTHYALNIIKQKPSSRTVKGSDLRAFEIALSKFKKITAKHSLSLQINRSGAIPHSDQTELDHYIGVYVRGMQEVDAFLNQ